MHHNPRQSWKRLVFESRKKLLKEAEENPPERGNDSIDVQVDRFLSEYESGSKMSKNEGKDWRRLLRRLLEAEGDEEEADPGAAGEGGDEEEVANEKLTIEDLDLNSFASSVARLIDNYDSLLEIKTTILRRAINFMNKNYELDVAEKFKETMEDQFDLSVDSDVESADEFQAPPADRAGGSGGGGA